jgi:membrane protein required for colicin V production
MQAYDLIMLVVLAFATILGAIKGFAWQVASLASIFVSYLVAVNFRFDLAKMIQAAPPWNLFLAMLILYVGTSFVIWVGFRLLSGAIDQVRLKEFDRHLGAVFGLAKGGIYCLLITMFAMTLLGPKQQEAICQSRSGYYIANALDNASGVLPKELHEVVGPYLERLDQKLHQQFPVTEPGAPGGGIWPSTWANGAGVPGGTAGGVGSAGTGLPGPGAHGTNPEQGAGSGWNFWPSGAAPQLPASAPAPQN